MDNNLDEKKLTPEQRAAKAPDAAVQKRTIKDRLLSAFRTGMGKDKKVVAETIRKVDGGYRLVAGSGRNLGTYPTKGGAEKREKQVNYFKHMGEDKKRQVEPPPEAMASDTRIKPLPKKGKHTTGSFNKFGNFTPAMKEEDQQDVLKARQELMGAKGVSTGNPKADRARKVKRLMDTFPMKKEPPPEAMASDTRIKPLPKKGKHTTGSFNKFGNFTPGMKEEVEQVDENDYSRRRRREEDIISGKKPKRKKIPMGSDYAARRRKERLANNSRMDEANYVATADSNPDMLAASRYGTTTTQAPKGTEKDYQKLLKRQIRNRMGLHRKPNLPEEAEQIDEINKDTVTNYKTKATNVKRALPSLKREFQRKIEKAEALAAQHSPGGKLPRGVGRNPAIAARAKEEAAEAKKSLAVFDRWHTNRTKGLDRAEKRLEEAAGLKRIYLKKNPSNDKVSVHGVDMNGNVNALGRELHIDLARLRARTHAKKHGLTKASEFNYIKEASDLHCPECDANHGKDRENPQDKKCNQCGHKFKNIHGFKNETDNDPEAAAWLKNFKEEVEQIDELTKQRASELSARAKKHQNLGDEAKNKGDFETANRHYNHAGKIYTHITNRSMVATRKNLADMKKMRGELEEGIGAVNRAFGLKPYGVLNPPPKRKPGLITKIKNKIKDKLGIYEAVRKPEHTHAVVRQGNVLSYHKSSKSAHKRADKLDLDYGAVAHSVRRLEPL
jgi:tetratricopeptide (TPR) repeat protein